MQAANGNFYGTAAGGGANGGGTIFEITPRGKLTTLYNFCSQPGCTDGYGPGAGLVQATNGNFYGTTESGGKNGADSVGTIFELTSGGSFATLYRFCPQLGCTDGSEPAADLIQATNGSFYGTTYDGGTDGDGSVFRLSMGLRPFVETLPTSGKIGTAVKILGNKLTGATSVTFNGTPAPFTVVSGTEIAATGKVVVTTSSANLTSNVNFRVR